MTKRYLIHRLRSNATTMLCMNQSRYFFRKYAFGADAEKLYAQILWLQQHAGKIPLPSILEYKKEESFCYYDMPYNNTVSLFDYAHSMPKEHAWDIIREVLGCLESSLYMLNVREADPQTVKRYIGEKVQQNISRIVKARYIKPLLEYEEIIINNTPYKNLTYYLPYLTEENLSRIFAADKYSDIHGDLTVENIICQKETEKSFYIIDPNTGNIHDSPNLDYAKLLQSVHGGYEFLVATPAVKAERNRIDFVFIKSEAYTYLSRQLEDYMEGHFGRERTRSIYYHEIVHWLRLMPYKIEKDGKRSLLFYAGMLIVMDDVIKKFGKGD